MNKARVAEAVRGLIKLFSFFNRRFSADSDADEAQKDKKRISIMLGYRKTVLVVEL